MAVFHFDQSAQFARAQTFIRRPKEFAYFSYDDSKSFLPFSNASLVYYYPPRFDTFHGQNQHDVIDLSVGFDSFIKRNDDEDEHLDGLLKTLHVHEQRSLEEAQRTDTGLEEVRTRAHFVTWRGMMTKIMTALFDEFNEFEMNATLFQDSIFIEENHAAKAEGRNAEAHRPARTGQPSQEMMQYWGYKFETLSTLSKPWAQVDRDEIEHRHTKVVNNHAQYCSIVKTGIGDWSLIIAGEVDAVLGEKPADPAQPAPWIELKTTQEIRPHDQRDTLKFERKLIRFWAQSFLLGVPKIMVGFRTSHGHLTRIQEMETQKIPQLVKASTWAWDGNASISFTAQVLAFLQQNITGEGVWRIQRKKGQKSISVFRVETTGTGSILEAGFKAHRESLLALEQSAVLHAAPSETDLS